MKVPYLIQEFYKDMNRLRDGAVAHLSQFQSLLADKSPEDVGVYVFRNAFERRWEVDAYDYILKTMMEVQSTEELRVMVRCIERDMIAQISQGSGCTAEHPVYWKTIGTILVYAHRTLVKLVAEGI